MPTPGALIIGASQEIKKSNQSRDCVGLWPFECRLDWVSRDRFDIQWHRHTGVWYCLYRGLSLTEALNAIETDQVLHPV